MERMFSARFLSTGLRPWLENSRASGTCYGFIRCPTPVPEKLVTPAQYPMPRSPDQLTRARTFPPRPLPRSGKPEPFDPAHGPEPVEGPGREAASSARRLAAKRDAAPAACRFAVCRSPTLPSAFICAICGVRCRLPFPNARGTPVT